MLDRIAIGTLALAAALLALTFRDYGLGWDDYTHSQYGELLLALYASGFRDTRALSFVNLYMYGGGFDMLAALLAKVLPFDLFETRRLAGALVGIAGLAVTWRIARRIGGPLAGLLALLMLAACPLYIGHMFINPKDMPFAVAMALFLLGLVRLLEEYPQPGPATGVIVGAGFGLALGSRIMAGLGVLNAAAALAFRFAIEWHAKGARTAISRAGRCGLALLPAALIAIAVMVVVWPWVGFDPLNLFRAIHYFATFFEKPWQELFGGALIAVPDMPRSYVPTLLGLQLPEIFLLLAVPGALGTLAAACRPSIAPRRRAIFVAVGLAALLPIALAVITRPAMYNGLRHFVFVLPPLAVAGGLAGAWLAARVQRVGRAALTGAAAALVIGLALPVIEMVRLHPYQYAYFNRIPGGMPGAHGRYMLDYWGLSFKQAGHALRERLAQRNETPPAGRKWKIAVCGPHPPASVALGDAFEPTWDPKGADFALMLGEFYCATLDAPIIAEIVREGVVFARVYDIRGRNVEKLFTQPPIERD